jgi:hypothetical protein
LHATRSELGIATSCHTYRPSLWTTELISVGPK